MPIYLLFFFSNFPAKKKKKHGKKNHILNQSIFVSRMSSEDEEDICNITIVGGRYNGEKCSAKEGECEHSNSKAKRKRKQEDENEEDWNEDIIIDEEMCGEQTKKRSSLQ